MSRRRSLTVAAMVVSMILTGCDADLAGREAVDTPFSMYGVITPDRDTQSVVIYPVEMLPTIHLAETFGADVYSTDLTTGERLTWRDTVVTEVDGKFGFIYWSAFQAQFGHSYLIEVIRRSDGARSAAKVRVPDPVTARVVDDRNPRSVRVLIEGEDMRALDSRIAYVMNRLAPGCRPLRNEFSYEGRERRVEQGWELDINLVADRYDILFECDGLTVVPIGYCPPYMSLQGIHIRFLVGDVAWDPPGGVLDGRILSLPSTMSNVENGYGFIGAGYLSVVPLYPATETLNKACFAYGD